ncbi:MAG: maleylpyruvate isomerase N-terminal domain-containing protein [Bacteroidota bacterium]
MNPIIPIPTAHLFPILDQKLEHLLQALSPEQWELSTIVPKWNIRKIACHLLDTNIRTLSVLRDDHLGSPPEAIHSYQDLIGYLNRLNADWITATQRLSPALLIDLLIHTGKQCNKYWEELPPFEPARFGVAWAGQEESPNWFHMAREYTEKWHHQQQIRLAVGETDVLYAQALYFPHLETSMQALPHHYRNIEAPTGTSLAFTVSGVEGGTWYLERLDSSWEIIPTPQGRPDCHVHIPGEIAWRLFTKGISHAEAAPLLTISGQKALGSPILNMLAVMA